MVWFERLSPSQVGLFWGDCLPHLEKSFFRHVHVHAAEDLKPRCLSDECQLWVAHEGGKVIGAAVTTLEEGSQAKVCFVLNLGGTRLKEWIGQLDLAICAFARDNGCDAVEAVTRPGFSRYVPDFIEDGRVYIKKLKG